MRSAALAFALLLVASRAGAEEYWTYEEDVDPEYVPRLRFAPHMGLWFGEFDRTMRGCSGGAFGGFAAVPRGPGDETDFRPSCSTNGSSETGFSIGASAVYRVPGPIHLPVRLETAFTFPERFDLEQQFIIAMPVALGITFDEWHVRPIFQMVLTPYVGLPDLRRGFTYGSEGGLAVRLGGVTDLQLTGGYHASGDWRMGIIRVAGYFF